MNSLNLQRSSPSNLKDPVFHSFNAGWIAFSYLISLVGTITTVELLHRRSCNRGFYNWYLLLGASAAMGGVAIWYVRWNDHVRAFKPTLKLQNRSMHFVRNTAIVFDAKTPKLMYSPWITVLSLLLPIGVVTAAFLVFTFKAEPTSYSIGLGGILMGSAIVRFHGEYVAGACLIAVSAAAIALGLLFRFKSKWSSHIWKRFMCAMLLAAAVSIMHWVAVLGTDFYHSQSYERKSSDISTTSAGYICGALLSLALLWRRYALQAQKNAREVHLALCFWDLDGRIMINSQGMLPRTHITKAYFDDDWDDDLHSGHPVFCWMYRVSRNWKCVLPVIFSMCESVESLERDERLGQQVKDVRNRTSLFRQQFCAAAYRLAEQLDLPLEKIGILYTTIVDTSTAKREFFSFSSSVTPQGSIRDSESVASRTVGHGRMLLLVRHGSRYECDRLSSQGFSFAPAANIATSLARHAQMPTADMAALLEKLLSYRPAHQAFKPGLYLSLFCAKPNMYQNFDVLTAKGTNLLPSMRVEGMRRLSKRHVRFFEQMSQARADDLMRYWKTVAADNSRPIFERDLSKDLLSAVGKLSQFVGSEVFTKTLFTSPNFYGPCDYALDAESGMTRAPFYAFRVMEDIHCLMPDHSNYLFIPHRLFVAQQLSYRNCPELAKFASSIHRDFCVFKSGIGRSERLSRDTSGLSPCSEEVSNVALLAEISNRNKRQASTQQNTTARKFSADESDISRSPSLGGILVSNEISIHVDPQRRASSTSGGEEVKPKIKTFSFTPSVVNAIEAEPIKKESKTFADELLKLVIKDHLSHQRRQSSNLLRPFVGPGLERSSVRSSKGD